MELRHIRYRVTLLVLAPCTLGVVVEAPSDAWCAAVRAATEPEFNRSPIIKRGRGTVFGLRAQSFGSAKQLVQRTAALSAALSGAEDNEQSDEAEDQQTARNATLSFPLKSVVSHASMPAVQITAQGTVKPNVSEYGRLHVLARWVNSSKYFRTTLHVILHSRLALVSMPKTHGIFLVFMLGCFVFIITLWLRSAREGLEQIETNQSPSGRKSPICNTTRLHLGKGDSLASSRTVPSIPQQFLTTNDMLVRTASWPVEPGQQRFSTVQDSSLRSSSHLFSPRRCSESGPVSGQPRLRTMACLCPELLVPDKHECYVTFQR